MNSFIARQPIFNCQQKVYGYEMLFRSGAENVFDAPDSDAATSKVISDCCLLLGPGGLMQNKRAFINATGAILTERIIDLLPSKQIVIEILETVEPDREVLKACRELKCAGYRFSLDDFVYRQEYEPLIALADFIKVDFLSTSRDEQLWMADRFLPQGISLIAEKVEDHSVFQEALEMGYGLFQGFFFSKPQMLSWREIPGFKLHYFQLLQELQQPTPCFKQVIEIIKRNMALTYKLLRYINAASQGLRQEITSIEHALLLLGETEMKRWLSLVLLVSLAKDKPEVLMVQALTRAKFCEMLGNSAGLAHRADDLFMMGMFSLIDAILDRPLAEILKELPINADIKDALLNVGDASPLWLIHQCMLTYERGDWDRLLRHVACLKMDEATTSDVYLRAVEWADLQFEYRPAPLSP